MVDLTPVPANISRRAVRCINFVVVGNKSVGKSSLAFRFAHMNEKPNVVATPVLSTITRDDVKVNGQRASVLIWDTAGTEAFEAVAASYYRRAEGVLLVYDISRRETFEGLTKWYKAVRQYAPEVAIVAVVGHKSDMVEDRQVPYADGHKWAQDRGCLFFEASADTAEGVEEPFLAIVRRVLESGAHAPQTRGVNVDVQQPAPTAGGCRC